LTQGLKQVLIAVDWTQVGDFMILEASLVVAGRGIPFFSLSVPKSEIKGRQRILELSMEYACRVLSNPSSLPTLGGPPRLGFNQSRLNHTHLDLMPDSATRILLSRHLIPTMLLKSSSRSDSKLARPNRMIRRPCSSGNSYPDQGTNST
jgi:hypothetical protein